MGMTEKINRFCGGNEAGRINSDFFLSRLEYIEEEEEIAVKARGPVVTGNANSSSSSVVLIKQTGGNAPDILLLLLPIPQ